MFIDGNGNVGIGTTLPQAGIHILKTTNNLLIDSDNGTGIPNDIFGNISFKGKWFTGNTGQVIQGGIRCVKTQDNGSFGGGIQLCSTNGTEVLNPVLTTTHNGFVGIGITNPGDKLHVIGSTLSTRFYTTSGSATVNTTDVVLVSYFSGAGLLTVYGSNFMHVIVIGGVNGLTSYAKNTLYQFDGSRSLIITMSGTSVLARLSAGPTTVYWSYTAFI
jgi:hypothetical protein